MSLCGPLQRVSLSNYGSESPCCCLCERENGIRPLFLLRPGKHHAKRANYCETTPRNLLDPYRDPDTGGVAVNSQSTTTVCQRLACLTPYGPSYCVQHHISTLTSCRVSHLLYPVVLAVVDGGISPKSRDHSQL